MSRTIVASSVARTFATHEGKQCLEWLRSVTIEQPAFAGASGDPVIDRKPDSLWIRTLDGAIGDLIKRDFGSAAGWRADLKATGMGGRGWAWTAYDWDERRLFNYLGDAQNTFPIWNATPLVALDVYEHAYFLDYQTDRGSYIDAFFDNLDWSTVNDWVSRYQIQR